MLGRFMLDTVGQQLPLYQSGLTHPNDQSNDEFRGPELRIEQLLTRIISREASVSVEMAYILGSPNPFRAGRVGEG